MDHTMQEYISRQPTEMLWSALQRAVVSKDSMYSKRTSIQLILWELEKRYKNETGVVPDGLQQVWKVFLQSMSEVAADNLK